MNQSAAGEEESKIAKRDGVSPTHLKQRVLDLLQLCFRKSPDASQQFLDVGCGNGEFTRNELLPRCLPCRRIVAVDVSRVELTKAHERFSHPNIEYDFLDIGKDVSDFVSKYGQFDRVYSFGCLHWINQEVSFMNIERLLTPGGECLLVFPYGTQAFGWWRKAVQKERWNKYAEIVEAFLPKMPTTLDADGVMCHTLKMLEGAKLKPYTCEIVVGVVRDINVVIGTVLAPSPLVHLLSDEENKKFEEEMADIIRSDILADGSSGPEKHASNTLVVHATKRRA